MWSPQQSRSPRNSPYILRPVPIRRSLAAESSVSTTSHSHSIFSPTPSTPTSSTSPYAHSPVQPPRSQITTQSPVASPSSTQPSSSSNGGFLIKPQLLKQSPFTNFPAGVATSHHPTPPTSYKLVQPTLTLSPLPKDQFEKWSTSIKSWSPSPQSPKSISIPSTPQNSSQTRLPHQPQKTQQSSLVTPIPEFSSPSFPNDQPLNLTQATDYRSPERAPSTSSFYSFSSPSPFLNHRSPAFPVDLRSPPPLATPPSSPQIFGEFPSDPSTQPPAEPIFRQNSQDRSIVAMNPNDKSLIEATKQMDCMNIAKANQHPLTTINQQAMNSSNCKPGPSNQVNRPPPPPQQPLNNMTMETDSANAGIFCCDDNKITLHYPKSQRPVQPPPPPPPPPVQPPRKIQPCAPEPIRQVFRGLSTKVVEGSFSDILTDKLEDNYMKCRSLVMSTEGGLITPLRFLTTLCDRMGIAYHSESCQFTGVQGPNDRQFRTELYIGGFCGVAHGVTMGYSSQLAAAHVLERMRIHFRDIKQTNYALYPGTRFTRIGEKLESLCRRYDLGEVQLAVKDRLKQNGWGGGRMWGGRRWGGYRGGDLELKWECSCFVKKFMATVFSDDQKYGSYLAMKEMYLNFVKPPDMPVVQIKDYFAIGVDCPMFKDIHCSLLLHRPTLKKIHWMDEYGVPYTQLDAVLNDPRNNSGYLLGAPMAWRRRQNLRTMDEAENRFVRFKQQLDEALEWIQGAYRRNNLMGGARFNRQNGGRGGRRVLEQRQVNGGQSNGNTAAVETGDVEEMDAEDLEVEDIFHDACMEV